MGFGVSQDDMSKTYRNGNGSDGNRETGRWWGKKKWGNLKWVGSELWRELVCLVGEET